MCDVRRQQAYSFYTNTKRCTQQELKYKIFFLGVHFYVGSWGGLSVNFEAK